MPKSIFDDDGFELGNRDIDELSALGIGDRGYANVEPARGGDLLFEDQFERRAREIDRKPIGTKSVILTPSKRGPWTDNAQFGIEQEFAPDANNRQTILKLPEWGFPQVWSVMLGITIPTTPTLQYNVMASVEIGVGGTTETVEIDWTNGTAFSLVTNALNISAFYFRSSNIPSGLRLKAMVGRRSIPGTAPKRSFSAVIPPLGGTSSFFIEKYTKSFTLLPRSFSVSPYTADFLVQFSTSFTSPIFAEWTGAQILALGTGATFDIPGGARVIHFVNNGLVDPVPYQAIYNLGL